jgi:hypothetical protein
MAAIWDDQEKPGIAGGGWDYNDNLIEYNSDEDPESSDSLKYNGVGLETVWSNENES